MANEQAAITPRTGVARLMPGFSIKLETVADLMALADVLYKGGASKMPNVDRPEKVARIILAGAEVGLTPAQSLDSIWLGTNGKASIWGDGGLALVRASGLLEKIEEFNEGEGDNRKGVCIVTRRGDTPRRFEFSIGEAKKAKLIERAKDTGPWATYPDRQSIMRARGFALRDVFTDVMRGLVTTEELQDYDVPEVKVISSTANSAPQLPAASDPAKPAMVEDSQLEELSKLRPLLLVAKDAKEEADQQRVWLEALAPFGVTTARNLTRDQAAVFIAKLGAENDPFGHAATKPSSAT